MATVDNRFDMHAEKYGSSTKSDMEVSFRIDDLMGEAMQLVTDRAGDERDDLLADMTTAVCASLWPALKIVAGGICKSTSGNEVEQYSRLNLPPYAGKQYSMSASTT